ncbi:MAG: leucine-rich repeat protein [Lachnospiraceae bacterium]|nr:leucine-rich repeat protein [Lachnospiraceae bacterium]
MKRPERFFRIIAVLAAVCLFVTAVPEPAQVKAGDDYTFDGTVYGKYSDITYFNVDGVEDGKVGFDKTNGMIVSIYSSVTSADIPAYIDGVKVRIIADWVFQYKENLKHLTLPEGLEKIGQGNFMGLLLKEIDIPDSVTFLGKYCFNDNAVVEKIDLGSIVSIGESSFCEMESLKSITIPGSCKKVGDWCFRDCPALKTITVAEGVESIGQGFSRSNDSVETIKLPASLKSIGNYSFRWCTGLNNVTVGGKTVNYMHQFGELGIKLGDYPFTNCEFLRKDYSPSYKTSKWYRAVHELKLTGDYQKDILMIARSQIGYHEGDSFDEQHGNNTSGKKDFAEYNYFCCDPGTMWCGEFVDWCYAMAGVPDELYSLSSSENEYANEHTWSDTTYAGGSYKLKPGDVIMFIADEDKDHVILVESIDDNGDYITVHSVDGNHSQSVVTATWRIEKRTGRCKDYNYDTNGHVETIYGPDWSLASMIKFYNVRFDANGGTTLTDSKKVSNNAFYGILPIPERKGYTFDGWYTEIDGGKKITAYRTVRLTSDTTLYAHWSSGSDDNAKDDGKKAVSVTIKASKTKIKKSTVKKKSVSLTIQVTGSTDNVTFTNVSSSKIKKYLTVSDKGVLKFKKGAKKGTYQVKVTVADEYGNVIAEKTVSIKIK